MALDLLAVAISGIIMFYFGRSIGFKEGREHELDNTAQRHERMKRFSNF